MNIRTAPNTVVLPGDSPRRSRTTIVLVVLVVLALAAAAVVVFNLTRGDGIEATKATGSPAPPTPTTMFDPQAATKAAIQDAYRQSFDAFVAIASDPAGSPDDPRLSQHTIGNALAASQLTILKLRRAGQVYVGRVEVHPSVVELTADTATVVDCGIGDVAVVEVATERVVTPAGPPVGAAATATYRLINGVWMQNTYKDEKRTCAPAAS
ncbi:MAG: hypothetical protein ACR2LJ_12115 [Acidimicrobiales bacterium]